MQNRERQINHLPFLDLSFLVSKWACCFLQSPPGLNSPQETRNSNDQLLPLCMRSFLYLEKSSQNREAETEKKNSKNWVEFASFQNDLFLTSWLSSLNQGHVPFPPESDCGVSMWKWMGRVTWRNPLLLCVQLFHVLTHCCCFVTCFSVEVTG